MARGAVADPPALFELEVPVFGMVPCCGKCGARGEPIPCPPDDWREAVLWAVVAIAKHEEDFH